MHFLILLMIVAVTTFPYLIDQGILPPLLIYTPEILSLVAAVYVIVIGVQDRFRYVRSVYWLVFAGLVVSIVCSVIINQVQAGPVFGGIRFYLRALPFFLLPAVLLITGRQLKLQLSVLLAVCLAQLLVAGQQRLWAEELGRLRGSGWASGDYVIGMLQGSGLLTLFCIGAACVLTAFYLRRQLSGGRYLVLLFMVLLPTTLNETKATLFLLPIALMTVFVVGSKAGTRLKNIVIGLVVTSAFLAVFIPIYDYFMVPRWGYGLMDFLTMEGRAENYLARGTRPGDLQEGGTLDGTIAALIEISRDPVQLVFGVGIGNASDSALGVQFSGAHFWLIEHLQRKAMTYIVLEHGVLGTFLVLLVHWLIFLDSARLAHRGEGAVAALALGWCGVSVVVAIGSLWQEMIASSGISYLYWYISGVVVAAAMRHDLRVGLHGDDVVKASSL